MSMIGNLVAITLEQLQRFIKDPDLIESYIYPDDGASEPKNYLNLEKAWHAIHFTLNGQAWEGEEPLCLAILGGEEIGDDMGYGAAHYLMPELVKAVAGALSVVTPEIFAEKFDPKALTAAEVYPSIWDEDEETLEYVQFYYDQLRTFYKAAAERNDAMLIYLN